MSNSHPSAPSAWHSALSTKPLALVLALLTTVGHLLPWASHRTAALTLSANDLAFFTHFTPGAGIFRNEWFYLPLGAAAIQIGLATNQRGLLARGAGLLLALAILALALPRYQFLIALLGALRAQGGMAALRGFEFGLQIGLCALFAIISIALALRQKWTNIPISAKLVFLLDFLCLVACCVPVLGFLSIRPAIETLYRDQIALGSGWWLTLGAIFGLALSGGAKMRHAFQS